MSGAGTLVQAAASNIIDDDGVGGVSIGGDFCLALTTMGGLEVWAVPLTPSAAAPPGRAAYAVALLNRSPGDDTVAVTWAQLPSAGTDWPAPAPDAAFDVSDVWQGGTDARVSTGTSRLVPAHGVVLLLLAPVV